MTTVGAAVIMGRIMIMMKRMMMMMMLVSDCVHWKQSLSCVFAQPANDSSPIWSKQIWNVLLPRRRRSRTEIFITSQLRRNLTLQTGRWPPRRCLCQHCGGDLVLLEDDWEERKTDFDWRFFFVKSRLKIWLDGHWMMHLLPWKRSKQRPDSCFRSKSLHVF